MNQIVIVEKILSDEMIDYVFDLANKLELEESKVGKRVDPVQKIRQDCFLSSKDCAPIDSLILNSIKQIFEQDFGVSVRYRERWKVGYYKGEDRGHYNAHTDIQGGMEHRQLSFVIALSDPADYQGGELYFAEIDRSFILEKGSAIIFRPARLHEVRPVTSGVRHMLISFMFDQENGLQSGRDLNQYTPQITGQDIVPISPSSVIKHYHAALSLEQTDPDLTLLKQKSQRLEIPQGFSGIDATLEIESAASRTSKDEAVNGNDQYLLLISTDSGPGNQIMGFKEALLMGAILKRKVLLPPVYQHYTEGRCSWNFSELFHYKIPDKVLDINADNRELIPDKTYVLHGAYLNKKLKVETLLGHDSKEQLLHQRHFRSIEDYSELSAIDEPVLCVKHLFNNTAISECLINGCHDCKTNPAFESLYSEICGNLDFSDAIKSHGEQFIQASLKNDYIAVHLRYPDVMANKSLESHANFNEENIHSALLELAKQEHIDPPNVFIATNKIGQLMNSPLGKFKYYDIEH
ncbi:MAG: 2OG-Fe(II) oxygenase, partial [Gammaproteobacteria bacterium]|nr:2OG-Fe(II) oxygenase [Gammaproteobacteria bacterium]